MEKDIHANGKKNAGVAMLISDKWTLKPRLYSKRQKKRTLYIDKGDNLTGEYNPSKTFTHLT